LLDSVWADTYSEGMTSRKFITLGSLTLGSTLASSVLVAKEAEMTEAAKIETLITYVENLKDVTFIRNGSDYDAKSAAKFLRAKVKAHGDDAKTAADFIAKLATGSSTSGKPYVLRYKDGSEKPCGEVLTAQLKSLTPAPKEK
jgi:hypothetical protein